MDRLDLGPRDGGTDDRGPARAGGPDLPPLDSDAWDAGLEAAFGSAGDTQSARSQPSVLERLGQPTGRRARVLLRDPDSDGGPVVRRAAPAAPTDAHAGRYRILGEIARGGVGVILKGRDLDLGRDLAMKVLRDDHAGNTELIQRFVEEAQIGGQLEHPGIVPVYELGVDAEQRPYFTMKLIRGRTLARLLEDRVQPAEDRIRFLRIFEQICDAMAYAHARGVVHRDLKPANILVGSFGEVQVADWGFAKVLTRGGVADEQSAHLDRRDAALIATVRSGPDGMESQIGSVMGTPSYMPPEQALGNVDQLDERTDVFALGAILCEILTGRPPYIGETIVQTAIKAQRADLTDALGRLDACGADAPLIALAKDCLHREQSERPLHAGKLAEAIRGYLAALETRAHDAQVEAARATERAEAERRSRRLTLVFGICVVALVLLAAGFFVHIRGARQERLREVEALVHDALRAATEHSGRGEYELAQAAVDRARALVDSEDFFLSDTLRERVERIGNRTARRLREEQFVAELAEVRASDDLDSTEVDVAYQSAFASFDIDIEDTSPEDVATRVGRGTPLAVAMAFALDDWVWRRQTRRPTRRRVAEPLIAIAQALDDDPWRHDLREAAAERDAERLLALADSQQGLAAGSLSPASLDTLALTLAGAREMERAVEVLETAARTFRGDFYLNFHLAVLLLIRGDAFERAEQHGLIALALRPESVATRMFLVRLYAEHGDLTAARRFVDEVVARDPGGLRTQLMRSRILQMQGDNEGALAVAEELAITHPEFVPGHYVRVHLLIQAGETARAREALRSALIADDARRATARERGAESTPPGRGRRDRSGRGGARSPDGDANGDGALAKDEAPDAVLPFFDVLDRDGNGVLELDELRPLRWLSRGASRGFSPNPRTRTDRERNQGGRRRRGAPEIDDNERQDQPSDEPDDRRQQ